MNFSTPDIVNGAFELLGGGLCWMNVKRLMQQKYISGVYWPVQAFFALWGFWNLFYYPHLGQWVSFAGGIILVVGNTIWVILAIHYMRKHSEAEVNAKL